MVSVIYLKIRNEENNMGFNIRIREVRESDRKKIAEDNINHLHSVMNSVDFPDRKPFTWYEEIDLNQGEVIYNDDHYYNFFSGFNRIVEEELQKDYKEFTINEMDNTWEIDCMDEKDFKEFEKYAPFYFYYGDSSGWTWTAEEIQTIKDYLIAKDRWKDVDAEVVNVFETTINNDAIVSLL